MAGRPIKAESALLPYSTIEAVGSGNVDAINAVLRHYERYIMRYCGIMSVTSPPWLPGHCMTKTVSRIFAWMRK